jgi:hypothetical protein
LNSKNNAAEKTVKAFGLLHISRLHHEAAGHEQHYKYIKNYSTTSRTYVFNNCAKRMVMKIYIVLS